VLHLLTSALNRGELSATASAALTPGKGPRYPLNRKLDCSEAVWALWRQENLFILSGIEPRLLGHPAQLRHYTD